ncbi:autotransporter outer membrane beta-barrel domain-containing protein [Dyella sp. Tek66A03]|uniref:autotransporter outer membrane beta-barrel domain-containing protein n=1 Tax=Dyella sp. Tek66A03 TaxID=3458298 RepID=UPI00403E8569
MARAVTFGLCVTGLAPAHAQTTVTTTVNANGVPMVLSDPVSYSVTTSATGTAGYGLWAQNAGGQITADTPNLSVQSANSQAAVAQAGGVITLGGTSTPVFNLTSTNALNAVYSTGVNSLISLTGGSVNLNVANVAGNPTAAVLVRASGGLSLTNTTVTTTSTRTTIGTGSAVAGLEVDDTGSHANLSNVTINDSITAAASLDQVYALLVQNGGSVTGDGVTLNATRNSSNQGSAALEAIGTGATINLSNVAITGTGAFVGGAYALSGASVSLNGGTLQSASSIYNSNNSSQLTATNIQATGALAASVANSATLTLTGGSVTMTGANAGAQAVYVAGGGKAYMTGTVVSLPNAQSPNNTTGVYALYVSGANSIATGNGVSLVTGNNRDNQTGAYATNGGVISLTAGSSVSVPSAGSSVGYISSGAWATGTGSSVSLTNSTVSVGGTGTYGVKADSTAKATLTTSAISTSGNNGAGLFISGAGSSMTVSANSSVVTSGTGAPGILLANSGALTVNGSSVNVSGASSNALLTTSGTTTASFSDSALASTQAAALAINMGTTNITAMNTIIRGNGTLLTNTGTSSSTVSLAASNGSTLTGAVQTTTGNTSQLNLASGSAWIMSGPSALTSFTLDAGILRYGAATTLSVTNPIDVVAGGGTIDTAGFSPTLGVPIQGVGTLTKTGVGTLTLTGLGSSLGSVDVSGGTLSFQQAGAFTTTGNVTTQAGATTDVGLANATLNIGGAFTQASGANLSVTVGASPDITAASAHLDGQLTINGFADGPTPVTASAATSHAYTVIHTTGGISGSFINNPLAPTGLDYLLHDGYVSANGLDYNLGFRLAWTQGGAAQGTGTFTLGAGTAFNVDIALGNQTGPFASGWDGQSLIKNGDGLLVLSGANTYRGTTTINAGTLQTGIANTFADSSNVVVNGGTLDLDGQNQLANRLAGSGGTILLNGATLTADNATMADNTTFAGVIGDGSTGGGSLVKTGTGQLTLTGSSIFAQLTRISAGSLQIGDGGTSGSVVSDIANQGALIFNRSDDVTYSGVLSGAGSLSKQGGGMLTLDGTGSSQGSVTVQQGTLQYLQTGAFSTTGDYTTLAGATTNIGQLDSTLHIGGVFTQVAGSTLDATLGASPDIAAQSAVLGGSLVINGFSDDPAPVKASNIINGQIYTMLRTTGGITGNFVNNPLQPSSPDYLLHQGFISANGLDYNLGFRLAWTQGGAAQGTGTFTVNANTAFNVDVPLSNQNGPFASGWDGQSLIKNGDGLLVLSAANTYTGSTTVNGGTLQTDIANTFANSSSIVVNSGTLDLNGNNQLAHDLTGGGEILLNGATLTANNATTADDTVYAGAITDGTAAGGALVKTGAGTLTLGGSTTYTGSTNIEGGTLALSGVADLSMSASTSLTQSGATLSIGAVSGAGAGVQNLSGVSGSQLLLVGKQLTVTNSADTTFAGVIDTSNGGLVKAGAGSLTLSGQTGYTGQTQINGGTLVLDGSAGGAQLTSDVVGQSGTRLSLLHGATLTGTIDPTNVSIDAASTWNLTGNSTVDTLTLAGQANFVAPASAAAVGRTLTLTNLIGQGGTIGLYTVLGDDSSKTDQLILNGGSASGTTSLLVHNHGGTGAQTTIGIPLVVATNGATTTTDAFRLSPQSSGYSTSTQTLAVGAYDYSLARGGHSGDANSWYLTTQSSTPEQPLVRPEAGVYLANNESARLMFMMTLRDREGYAQPDGSVGGTDGSGSWGRVVGGARNGRAAENALSTSADTALVQLGSDLWRGSVGQGTVYAGVMGSWGHLSTEAISRQTTIDGLPGGSATGSVDGYAAGVYGTWYQRDRGLGGAYVDTWGQYQWSTNKVNGSGLPQERYDADGFTASVETGYGFLLRQNSATKLYLEPQLQVAYVGYSADNHTEAGGTQVRFGQASGVVARVGARLYGDYAQNKQHMFRPYLEANYWYNQRGGQLSLNNDLVPGGAPRSFGEVKVGAIGSLGKYWLLSGDIGVQAGERHYNAVTARLGLKYSW